MWMSQKVLPQDSVVGPLQVLAFGNSAASRLSVGDMSTHLSWAGLRVVGQTYVRLQGPCRCVFQSNSTHSHAATAQEDCGHTGHSSPVHHSSAGVQVWMLSRSVAVSVRISLMRSLTQLVRIYPALNRAGRVFIRALLTRVTEDGTETSSHWLCRKGKGAAPVVLEGWSGSKSKKGSLRLGLHREGRFPPISVWRRLPATPGSLPCQVSPARKGSVHLWVGPARAIGHL